MVYVLSDVHGNERRFNSIIEQIGLGEKDSLYILGDVVDRYPGGIRLLQRIMNMPNAYMLLGNHEYMMLRALGCPYDADDVMTERDIYFAQMLWYQNGGDITHQCWESTNKDLQKEIIDFLRGLPINIDVDVNGHPYKLVHGAPVEDYTEQSSFENSTQFAVWARLNRDDMVSKNYTLVFGHTPTEYYHRCTPMEPWHGTNCIGVDCGCAYPENGPSKNIGRLACLCLDNGTVFYSDETKRFNRCA